MTALSAFNAQLELSTDDWLTWQPHGDPRPCDAGPITWNIDAPETTPTNQALARVVMILRDRGERFLTQPWEARRVAHGDTFTVIPSITPLAT